MSQLRSAKNQEEVKAAIKSINTLHGEQHFDYVKPTELGMQQANQAQNLNLKSKLELE